ncbi:cytochrome b5 domain-containing protein 1 isoform X1 [Fopius arisanus]|uniref:Cytochrome b5 domain-containing protein 1 n=1 Tax=Fopius arisanus TaxID=64838 RepID=A0A9R1T0L0_9HYME|nr:PREDICTED: cytochrome b5 domain-containing protein 1 isoform X1 [Fopius arisanus]
MDDANPWTYASISIIKRQQLSVDSPKCQQEDDPEACIEDDVDLYYLPTEVAVHNTPEDCWLSYLHTVYDLSDLCKNWRDTREISPIIAHAGKDISHWFDHSRGDIKHHVDRVTGHSVPFCPHGPIPHVGTTSPVSTWRPIDRCPWWLDQRYKKGRLTKNSRPCRIINTLTGCSAIISVCEEDTIRRIQERFLIFNANGRHYDWKFEGKDLDMSKTLTENGIPDERERYTNCGLPSTIYIPSLLCYYRDDPTHDD